MAMTSFALAPADPILAAIDVHACAWTVFQITDEGAPARAAEAEMSEALAALLGTPCTTSEGAQALRRHLRWYVMEEAENGKPDDCLWLMANARLADLVLLMRDNPGAGEAPSLEPFGAVVGRVIHRLSRAGETLAAVGLIVGGMILIGHASLIG